MSVAGIIQGAVRSAVNVGRIGTCLLAYNPFDILNGVNLQDGVYDTWTLTRGSANATPKSDSFTSPARESSTLAGDTSRCTMPMGRPSSPRSAWR